MVTWVKNCKFGNDKLLNLDIIRALTYARLGLNIKTISSHIIDDWWWWLLLFIMIMIIIMMFDDTDDVDNDHNDTYVNTC